MVCGPEMLLPPDIIAAGLLCSLCRAAPVSTPSHAAHQQQIFYCLVLLLQMMDNSIAACKIMYIYALFGRGIVLLQLPHGVRLLSYNA